MVGMGVRRGYLAVLCRGVVRPARLLAAALAVAMGAAVLAACGGSGGGDTASTRTDTRRPSATIGVWILEDEPARVRAAKADLARFTRATGIGVRMRALDEDDLAAAITSARADRTLPDALQLPLASVHAYAADGVIDTAAAGDVLDRLGDETFSQTALSLVSRDGIPAAVPSDGWGELLIYRKDLFEKAGLEAPKTLQDVRVAAEKLNQGRTVGITLATAPGDGFTHETFEHVALAMGCQLVNDDGDVQFTSNQCVEALRYYGDLAKNFSVEGNQDVDSTRGTYFAGRAAMMFWSPFLLDGMAGLRDDTRPSCAECKEDPAFLAKNSGLVGPLSSNGGKPSQFGSVSTFNISVDANKEASQAFVEFMMNEGYTRWLGLSPQGKYPVRLGDQEDGDKFANAWERLDSGVDRKAPLTDFYSEESIASLKEGVQSFQRWGFAQGQGALIGALRGEQPIAKAVADVIGGKDPAQAAKDVQAQVEEIQAGLQ